MAAWLCEVEIADEGPCENGKWTETIVVSAPELSGVDTAVLAAVAKMSQEFEVRKFLSVKRVAENVVNASGELI